MVNENDNESIKKALSSIKSKLFACRETTSKEVISGGKLPKNDDLILSKKDFNVKNSVKERIKAISNNSSSAQIYADISNAKNAFTEIKSLEEKKYQLKEQEKSLELIYNKFVEQEKSGLKNFISVLFESINRFYQKMNPEEPFQDIKITDITDKLSCIVVFLSFC